MTSLLVFGAAGDLAGRYLFPAIAQLMQSGALPAGLRIRGGSREALDDSQFRDHVAERLTRHAAGDVSGHARRPARADRLPAGGRDRPCCCPGRAAGPAWSGLGLPRPAAPGLRRGDPRDHGGGPARGQRLVIEKPFGQDLASARELNALCRRSSPRTRSSASTTSWPSRPSERARPALRQPGLRAGVERPPHRARRHRVGRDAGAGGPGRLLRPRRRAERHAAEPPAADAGLVAMEPPISMSSATCATARSTCSARSRPLGAGGPADPCAAATPRGASASGASATSTSRASTRPRDRDLRRGHPALDNWRWAGVPFRLRSGKALGTDRARGRRARSARCRT